MGGWENRYSRRVGRVGWVDWVGSGNFRSIVVRAADFFLASVFAAESEAIAVVWSKGLACLRSCLLFVLQRSYTSIRSAFM